MPSIAMVRPLSWLAAIAVAACCAWAAPADAYVYWANQSGSIGRANLDGSGANQSFVVSTTGPVGVAVDDRYLYWTDQLGIGRANLDGSGANQSFVSTIATRVAVDGRHVYWASSPTGTIGRANLDGSDVDETFVDGASQPSAVAVDGQHLYWLNATAATIGRANLDGSDPDQGFIAGAVSFGVGVAVDGGPPGSASVSATSLAFATQPLGTLGPPQAVSITNAGHGNLEIGAARVATGDVDDFLVSRDTCSQSTLTIGATCTIDVRFGPTAAGERRATLALSSIDPASPLEIALQGTAGQLPQGPGGAIGAIGATGAPGAQGPVGPRGPAGAVRLVTCRTVTVRVAGRRVKRRRCTTRAIGGTATFTTTGTARASLARGHVLYATGTAHRTRLVLQLRRRVPAGAHTLTLSRRRRIAVTIA